MTNIIFMHYRQGFFESTFLLFINNSTLVTHCKLSMSLAIYRDVGLIILTSRAHWPLARLTLTSTNYNFPNFQLSTHFLTHRNFLGCDEASGRFFLLNYSFWLYHILENFCAPKNVWIIENLESYNLYS